MRIVTRPDFDGVVCAVLLLEAEPVTESILWVEPGVVQSGNALIEPFDIMANLPYDGRCAMWFDHHFTNRIPHVFKGAFAIAPSAAGVIYNHYKDCLKSNFEELVRQADKIDSADLTEDEVGCPENYPHVLLSMTISGRNKSDEKYWNHLVGLLRGNDIHSVMEDNEVAERCQRVVEQNRVYRDELTAHTKVHGPVAVTDFRSFSRAPEGNRFLVYSLFRETVVSVRIRYDQEDHDQVILSVGHSIFNRHCNVNAGLLLSRYHGGGHFGAAACRFHKRHEAKYVSEIIEILESNTPLT